MWFEKAREKKSVVRCIECQRMHYKEDCWRCDVCDRSSCDSCGAVAQGFSVTMCGDCKEQDAAWKGAQEDMRQYRSMESYLSWKGEWNK